MISLVKFVIFKKFFMKMSTFCCCFIFAFTSLTAVAQNMDSTAMKNWMEYMTPGHEHAMMASWNGKWTGEVSMWMEPGTSAMKSKAITTNSMVLGGRYQQSKHEGDFAGMPFEGMSTLAFDKAKKVFISTWIDNMGTGMMIGEGPWDEAKKTITIVGTMVDPSTGAEMRFKEIFHITDRDHQTLEMFAYMPDGSEFRTMEIKYTRNK